MSSRPRLRIVTDDDPGLDLDLCDPGLTPASPPPPDQLPVPDLAAPPIAALPEAQISRTPIHRGFALGLVAATLLALCWGPSQGYQLVGRSPDSDAVAQLRLHHQRFDTELAQLDAHVARLARELAALEAAIEAAIDRLSACEATPGPR